MGMGIVKRSPSHHPVCKCMAFRKPKQSLLVTKENFVYLEDLR